MTAHPARSAAETLRVVAKLNPAANPKYRKRDVTGDGIDETFCNWFVADFCRELGVIVPAVRCNELWDWFKESAAWQSVSKEDAHFRANTGGVVIAIWRNPVAEKSGHIVAVIPNLMLAEIRVAQAGRKNFNSGSLAQAFGNLSPVSFYSHP